MTGPDAEGLAAFVLIKDTGNAVYSPLTHTQVVANQKETRCCWVTLLRACVLSRFSRVRLFATPWTVAHQAPLSMGLPRQEHWRGLPFSPPGDIPNPGIKPASPTSPALADRFCASAGSH